MRILIACGGTGGHIFPAVSLAQELRKRGYSDIVFTTDDNMRTREIIEDTGFAFKVLKVPKMPYRFSVKWLPFFIRAFISRLKAEIIVSGLNPGVAVGFGAYISGPVIAAAKSMYKKTLIHEQNVTLGRANRLLLNKADKVCFSFDNRLLGKGDKYILTGNPIRGSLLKELEALTKEEALSYLNLSPHKKTLLVLGGSRGAQAINRLFVEFIQRLREIDKVKLQIVHITGDKDLEFVSRNYQRSAINHWVKDFYDRMGLLYKTADLIICRCGATTIAEACLFGIPAILIPYPGAGSHQRENARVVTEAGGAVILEQEDATADNLEKQILTLINDEVRIRRMSDAMRSLARSDATLRLADAVEELVDAK